MQLQLSADVECINRCEMVFSSLIFLLYFLPIAILGYYLLGFSVRLQNVWLLLISLVFYAWGEPVHIVIMLASIAVNWIFGLLIGKQKSTETKSTKVMLVCAIVYNLGVLFAFKYVDFFIDNINAIAGKTLLPNANLGLPIGISFFTFQAMSYVIDVYRKDAECQKNIFNMGLYISFFPQLVAGPIVRYNSIEKMLKERKNTFGNFSEGIHRFAIGFIKKVLIANNIAVVTDTVYELVMTGRSLYETPALMAWMGCVGYMLQIYFDFSAYSDMAIGLGRIFGFSFDENFDYPYVSKSIGEFWRRWHISLGSWFREYVYIPLGGSRVENQDLMVKNTLIVWLLTGMWHGASWNFILWGLFFFVFLIFERAIGLENLKIPSWIKRLYALVVVFFGWILFRTENLYQMREMIKDMFMLNDNCFANDTAIWMLKEYWLVFAAAILFSTPIYRYLTQKVEGMKNVCLRILVRIIYFVALCVACLVAIMSLVRGGYNPFIYFNF